MVSVSWLCRTSPVIGRSQSQSGGPTADRKRKRLSDVFADEKSKKQSNSTLSTGNLDRLECKGDDRSLARDTTKPAPGGDLISDSVSVDMFGDDDFSQLLPPDRKVL